MNYHLKRYMAHCSLLWFKLIGIFFFKSHLTTKYYENFLFNDSFSVHSFMQPEHAFHGKNKINWSFVKNIILTFKFWFLLGNWFSSLSNMHLTLSGKVLHFVVQFVNISRVSCLTLKGEISFPCSTHKHRVRENASSI